MGIPVGKWAPPSSGMSSFPSSSHSSSSSSLLPGPSRHHNHQAGLVADSAPAAAAAAATPGDMSNETTPPIKALPCHGDAPPPADEDAAAPRHTLVPQGTPTSGAVISSGGPPLLGQPSRYPHTFRLASYSEDERSSHRRRVLQSQLDCPRPDLYLKSRFKTSAQARHHAHHTDDAFASDPGIPPALGPSSAHPEPRARSHSDADASAAMADRHTEPYLRRRSFRDHADAPPGREYSSSSTTSAASSLPGGPWSHLHASGRSPPPRHVSPLPYAPGPDFVSLVHRNLVHLDYRPDPGVRLASSAMPTSSSLLENDEPPVERLVLTKLVGRGSFGSVYLGNRTLAPGPGASESPPTDPPPGDPLARLAVVKLLKPHHLRSANGEVAKAFLREIGLLRMLRHPRIMPLLGSGSRLDADGGEWFYVMPFFEAGSLREWLSLSLFKYLTLEKKIQIAMDLLHAVAYLHSHGVAHRDIKPDNIFIESSQTFRVCLGDFGMVLFVASRSRSADQARLCSLSSAARIRADPVSVAACQAAAATGESHPSGVGDPGLYELADLSASGGARRPGELAVEWRGCGSSPYAAPEVWCGASPGELPSLLATAMVTRLSPTAAGESPTDQQPASDDRPGDGTEPRTGSLDEEALIDGPFRADVWSVGSVLYELFSLETPYRPADPSAFMRNVRDHSPEPLSPSDFSSSSSSLSLYSAAGPDALADSAANDSDPGSPPVGLASISLSGAAGSSTPPPGAFPPPAHPHPHHPHYHHFLQRAPVDIPHQRPIFEELHGPGTPPEPATIAPGHDSSLAGSPPTTAAMGMLLSSSLPDDSTILSSPGSPMSSSEIRCNQWFGLIHDMLAFVPGDRPTAREALERSLQFHLPPGVVVPTADDLADLDAAASATTFATLPGTTGACRMDVRGDEAGTSPAPLASSRAPLPIPSGGGSFPREPLAGPPPRGLPLPPAAGAASTASSSLGLARSARDNAPPVVTGPSADSPPADSPASLHRPPSASPSGGISSRQPAGLAMQPRSSHSPAGTGRGGLVAASTSRPVRRPAATAALYQQQQTPLAERPGFRTGGFSQGGSPPADENPSRASYAQLLRLSAAASRRPHSSRPPPRQ